MKQTLATGLSNVRSLTVDANRTIDFMGDDLRVYATPELVRDIEHACRDLLLEHVDEGEDSVGTRVEIDHTGATLLGMGVEITATVTEVQGRLITFEVVARDDLENIAKATHVRFVVGTAKLAEKLRAKADKISA